MTNDLHSCSYYCDRPECVKRQRDELREKLSVEECFVREWHDRYSAEVIERTRLRERLERLERDTPTICRLRDFARLQAGEARMPECLVFGEILDGLDTVLGDTHE